MRQVEQRLATEMKKADEKAELEKEKAQREKEAAAAARKRQAQRAPTPDNRRKAARIEESSVALAPSTPASAPPMAAAFGFASPVVALSHASPMATNPYADQFISHLIGSAKIWQCRSRSTCIAFK